MNLLWQIVPVDSGYQRINTDANGKHYLSDKGKDTNPDERLLFRNREDAQEYIDTFLNENFRIEDCWIADVYIEQFNIKIN
jgi:hypothetical protein